MSRYDEDKSDKLINNNKLKDMFNISQEPSLPSIQSLEVEARDIKSDRKDPDDIIYDNIERASRLLDKIELELENSSSARMFEVAAGLINAITQASTSIIGNTQHYDEQLYKEKLLQLKEREISVKEALNNRGNKTVNNILVTDRESLLKIIKEEPKEID